MLKLFMQSNIRLFTCHGAVIEWVWPELVINDNERSLFNKIPPLMFVQPIHIYTIIVKGRQ